MNLEFLAVLLALAAACSNACSNIVQRITNRDESEVQTLSLRLIKDLLHRPLWFAGLGAVMVSFILQASALRFGPLALVQPLLIFELPLTFLGAAIVLHAPLGKREWVAAVVMTGGLAALITFLDPRGSVVHSVSPYVWVVGLGSSTAAVAALVFAGWRTSGDRRAAFYGAATGIQFGTTAALMKGAVGQLSSGVVALFSSWETYAMAAAGVLAMYLVQNALQSGKIVAAQPGITLLDPVVAIVWGLFGFSETVSTGPVHLGLATAGGVLMIAGALLLSRSPILDQGRQRAASSSPPASRSPGAGEPEAASA